MSKIVDFVSYQDGAVVSHSLLKKEAGNITIFAFDQGQGLSEHTAPFDAVVCVLEGKAKITISGEPTIVGEGELIVMPANEPHALEAVEKFKMMLIMLRS